jgi:hypothetical protein
MVRKRLVYAVLGGSRARERFWHDFGLLAGDFSGISVNHLRVSWRRFRARRTERGVDLVHQRREVLAGVASREKQHDGQAFLKGSAKFGQTPHLICKISPVLERSPPATFMLKLAG